MDNRTIFLKEQLKKAQDFLANANAVIESDSSDVEKTLAELEKETWLCQIDELNRELSVAMAEKQ